MECGVQGREEVGYAVLPQPFRVSFGGLGGEDPHHLAESGDTGLTGDGTKVDENLGSAACRNAGPHRVGEREVVNQFARAWPFTFGE